MSDEKTYRTSAFHTNGGGGYLYRFWVMSPAYQKPGYQIKEHEVGVNCGCTNRIADELPEKQALERMAALEREGRAHHKIVTSEDLHELGHPYHDAQYFSDEHEALVAQKVYERLKSRRPGSDFRPK